jgi:hypothetical protein
MLALYNWSRNATCHDTRSRTLNQQWQFTGSPDSEMAPRRVQPTKTEEDLASENEDDDLDFLASQQSSGSDDHECDFLHLLQRGFGAHCIRGIRVS